VQRKIFLIVVIGVLFCACSRDPASKEARFLARGKKYLDQKDYARAALEFRSANQANPRNAEPWYQLGIAYLGAKQPDNAYVAFLKATHQVWPAPTKMRLSRKSSMLWRSPT